jgi:hypothetical protein
MEAGIYENKVIPLDNQTGQSNSTFWKLISHPKQEIIVKFFLLIGPKWLGL